MKILQLNPEERPREKVAASGAANVGTTELLAVLLRTGYRGANAVQVAEKLMFEAGNSLINLSRYSPHWMCRVPGIGMDKAVTLAAAMELGRRLAVEKEGGGDTVIGDPTAAYEVLRHLYRKEGKEECWCLFLKRSHKLITSARISEGGESMTDIDIRQIVRRAVDLDAASVILSHNHPSGDCTPSEADLRLTSQLREALEVFEVHLTDHLIVSENGYFSFSDEAVSRLSDRKRGRRTRG